MSAASAPRVVLVTGKGGVGKTTVSAALALRYAAAGLQTILVETAGAAHVPAMFGLPGQGYAPTRIGPKLWTMRLTPEEAIEDYIVQQVRFRRIYTLVFQNRVMAPFIEAVPGLHDAVQLGKVFDLFREQEHGKPKWDRIVVDAPATGHGLTMLGSARALMDLTRSGPLHDSVKQVQDVLGDPTHTALVLVSLAEALPVNETIELAAGLASARGLLRGVVLNAQLDDTVAPLSADVERALAQIAGGNDLLHLVARRRRRIAAQGAAATRLRTQIGVPTVGLTDLRWQAGGGVGAATDEGALTIGALSMLGAALPLDELGL